MNKVVVTTIVAIQQKQIRPPFFRVLMVLFRRLIIPLVRVFLLVTVRGLNNIDKAAAF